MCRTVVGMCECTETVTPSPFTFTHCTCTRLCHARWYDYKTCDVHHTFDCYLACAKSLFQIVSLNCIYIVQHINSMVDCMGASDGVKALFPNVRHLSCTVYCGDNDNDKKLNTARRWFHKLNHIHWQVSSIDTNIPCTHNLLQIHGSTNESLNDVSHMHVWLHDTFVFATCSVEV